MDKQIEPTWKQILFLIVIILLIVISVVIFKHRLIQDLERQCNKNNLEFYESTMMTELITCKNISNGEFVIIKKEVKQNG